MFYNSYIKHAALSCRIYLFLPAESHIERIEIGEIGMVKGKVTLKNPSGLHLRPAGIFCKEAMKFEAQITFGSKGSTANAKSVLSVLGACVKCGDEIELVCEGKDEIEALEAMSALIESGLGETDM